MKLFLGHGQPGAEDCETAQQSPPQWISWERSLQGLRARHLPVFNIKSFVISYAVGGADNED